MFSSAASSSWRVKSSITIKLFLMGSHSLLKSNTEKLLTQVEERQLGIDYSIRRIGDVAIQIWNLSALDRFATITNQYYKDANLILFCPQSPDDFGQVESVKVLINEHCKIVVVAHDETIKQKAKGLNLETISLVSHTEATGFLEKLAKGYHDKQEMSNHPLFWHNNKGVNLPHPASLHLAKASLDQSHVDWLRDASRDEHIKINGIDVKKLITQIAPNRAFEPADLLILWQKQIIEKLQWNFYSLDASQVMRFLSDYLHQGACLHLLQATLCEQATKKGYAIIQKDVMAQVKIDVDNNAIFIKEYITVAVFRNIENPEIEICADNKDEPAVRGFLTQKISLDSDENIKHETIDSGLSYGSNQIRDIIDGRTLFIKSFDKLAEVINLSTPVKTQIFKP